MKRPERFWGKVAKTAGCWLWNGAVTGRYGVIEADTVRYGAHRLSWVLHNGPIPNGCQVLHKCDNTLCVNPSHLFLGDPATNAADKVSKGRHPRGTQCPWHRLDEHQVLEIRARWDNGETAMSLSRHFGVSRGAIRGIVHRKRWRHLTDSRAALARLDAALTEAER